MLTVRPATADDIWWVYDVAMDPTTRAMSTRSESFTPKEHAQWFARRLSDPDQTFLIGMHGGVKVGYLRFGRVSAAELSAVSSPRSEDRSSAEVAIAIAPTERGKGHSVRLLLAGEVAVRERWPDLRRLVALILPHNHASVRAFFGAGYVQVGTEDRMTKRHMRLEKVF